MLFDGGCKPAEEIEVGDELLTLSLAGEHAPEVVVRTFSLVQPLLRFVHQRGEFFCSTTHRLLLEDRSDVPADTLKPGDHLVAADGTASQIELIAPAGQAQVYGWTCEPTHTFIASGILHHNKQQWYTSPPQLQALYEGPG
jgi:hypothetical protein